MSGWSWQPTSAPAPAAATEILLPFIDATTIVYPPSVENTRWGRLSQEPVEVLIFPDSAAARLSQLAVEALIFPDSAQARLSQIAVEVLIVNPLRYPKFHAQVIQ